MLSEKFLKMFNAAVKDTTGQSQRVVRKKREGRRNDEETRTTSHSCPPHPTPNDFTSEGKAFPDSQITNPNTPQLPLLNLLDQSSIRLDSFP